ncbi:hypothetical protein BJ138DRAFT_1142018 [Hygrophoropsis aurantiaca]|uniref:Uncharacterized protein n=1 Tax=Hygrophoropsis aurantiaca TaxID=72124 RepID=A0ACB8AQW5_9AGAM|nr:hypothetical protein BJ138DRAFT_1142018 [Hygrophoropsis aurantiaca]
MARKFIFSLFALLPAITPQALIFVRADCPAASPISLCCTTLQPYSSNSYVWENICGFSADASTPIGSMCSSTSSCTVYTLCCTSSFECQSGVDGPIGINCTTN